MRDPREEEKEEEEVRRTVRTSPRSVTRRRTPGGRRTRPTRRPLGGSKVREREDFQRFGEQN